MPAVCLARHDRRILAELQAVCPQSPEFVAWLVARLAATNGSLHTARLIIAAWRWTFPHEFPLVSAASVERLAVDGDREATGRIVRHVDGETTGLLASVMVLSVDLRGEMVFPPDAMTAEDIRVVRRLSVDARQCDAYVIIFICSWAMLSGVGIDPRRPTADASDLANVARPTTSNEADPP